MASVNPAPATNKTAPFKRGGFIMAGSLGEWGLVRELGRDSDRRNDKALIAGRTLLRKYASLGRGACHDIQHSSCIKKWRKTTVGGRS